MTILFYKELTRNPKIRNTPVWVLSNIWRRGELWIPNLARMSLIEYYWMLQHARGYSLYHFWVIKGKPTGGWEEQSPPTPQDPPSQIRVKYKKGFSIPAWMLIKESSNLKYSLSVTNTAVSSRQDTTIRIWEWLENDDSSCQKVKWWVRSYIFRCLVSTWVSASQSKLLNWLLVLSWWIISSRLRVSKYVSGLSRMYFFCWWYILFLMLNKLIFLPHTSISSVCIFPSFSVFFKFLGNYKATNFVISISNFFV